MTIRAQLSSDSIAVSCGIEVHVGSPVLRLCRELLSAGSPSSAAMDVYRGQTLALQVRSIGEAAGLRVQSNGCGFIPLRGLPTGPAMSPPDMKAVSPSETLTESSSAA